MKKFTIIALALCMSFMLAAPAMAVDADFSGDYRVRGSYVSHWDLDKDSASNAYMDMRFELQTVFKVSDILSVTARFDALEDHVWGDTDAAVTSGDVGNVNFNRAYMTIKSPVGKFVIGRAGVGYWGTTFVDTETEKDCIKFIKKIDNLTLYAVFMKLKEQDKTAGTAGTINDQADYDSDRYDLRFKYKMENVTAGLLLSFFNDKTSATQTTHTYLAEPFFVSKFGPLAIQGELDYKWGQTDYDTAGSADLDIKKLAYNLEATYNVGPASIMAGYAFISGDGNASDKETCAWGNVGDDWEKLFILTTSQVGILKDSLGNVGNLAKTNTAGAKIIYGGATFSPLDNLELGVVVGKADADELTSGYSKDDYGLEYDFTLNWKIYDNLTYSAVAAFLRAGDFYKEQASPAIPDADFDDTYALFHQLELAF
jgi:hypothetical protein